MELTLEEMQVIRRALRAYSSEMNMDRIEYRLYERFTSILLGDYN